LYRNRDRRNTTVRACPGTLEAEGHRGGSPPGAGKPPRRAGRPNRDPGNRAALKGGRRTGKLQGGGHRTEKPSDAARHRTKAGRENPGGNRAWPGPNPEPNCQPRRRLTSKIRTTL